MSEELLQAFYDGEAGQETGRVDAHVSSCAVCAGQLRAWQQTSQHLRTLIDVGVTGVEPLIALQAIRQRITRQQERSLIARLAARWRDLWQLNRRALVGAMAAAMVGALTAPAVVWWLTEESPHSVGKNYSAYTKTASVVVESLEFQDDANKAVVYNGASGLATLIWLAPGDIDSHGKHATEEF